MPGDLLRLPLIVLAACGCLAAWSGGAGATEPRLAVITAPQAPRLPLDRATLRNIFLKKIFVDADGQRLIPVNLPPASPLREAFFRELTHMPDVRMQDYWDRQYFQGVSPPYVLASQQAVVRFVATTPGAIGYVASCHVDASVQVVLTLSLPASAAGAADCGGSAGH